MRPNFNMATPDRRTHASHRAPKGPRSRERVTWWKLGPSNPMLRNRPNRKLQLRCPHNMRLLRGGQRELRLWFRTLISSVGQRAANVLLVSGRTLGARLPERASFLRRWPGTCLHANPRNVICSSPKR